LSSFTKKLGLNFDRKGSGAATIAPLTKTIERVDDDLTLEGLRLLWELNA
jgi:pantothenate kinase type III